MHQNQAIFGNDTVATHKTKVSLKLKKPAYVASCTLVVNRVLVYKLHYD